MRYAPWSSALRFSLRDDAFTFGSDAGESRTLTLSELGDVLALEEPIVPRERGRVARDVDLVGHILLQVEMRV